MSDIPISSQEPSCSTLVEPELETIQVLIENEHLTLPKDLLSSDVFFEVVSSSTFQNLSASNKAKLKKNFLPANIDSKELPKFLDNLCNPEIGLTFTNPVKKFHENLQCGYYDPDYVRKFAEIEKCLKLQHKVRLRDHYARLLKVLLIRRRKLIESSLKCAQGDKIIHSWESSKIDYKKEKLKKRSLKRAKVDDALVSDRLNSWLDRGNIPFSFGQTARHFKSQVGEHNLSSDDEDIASLPKDPAIYLASKHCATVVPNDDQQFSTFCHPNYPDLDLNQPSEMADIKVLLAEYKMLRKSDPDHPSLECSDITLDEVVERTGLQQPAPKQIVKKAVMQQPAVIPK